MNPNTVNRDADPPVMDPEEWGIDIIELDISFDDWIIMEDTGNSIHKTPEEQAADAYDRAKKATEGI